MTRSEAINLITKKLETATKHEVVNAYVDTISCGECPFWHDCSNTHMCYDYIFEKLEAKEE